MQVNNSNISFGYHRRCTYFPNLDTTNFSDHLSNKPLLPIEDEIILQTYDTFGMYFNFKYDCQVNSAYSHEPHYFRESCKMPNK